MSTWLLAALASVSYQVDARLDPDARLLEGRTEVRLRNDTGSALEHVDLWLYPNRFAEPAAGLDDVSFHWVYPRDFNPGGMQISELRVDGRVAASSPKDHPRAGQRTMLRVDLPRPVPPDHVVRLAMRFSVRIPKRYGSFGCASGVCTLAQGWHPLVAALGPDGAARMPPRADYRIQVTGPWPTVIGGRLSGKVALRNQAYVPLIAYERPHALEVEHRGVRIMYISRFASVPPSRERIPYGLENFYRIGSNAAKKALDLWIDLEMDPPPKVTLCEVPLRHEIAQPHGETALVSDRAWRLFPLERFRKFHTFQVARALFAAWIERRASEYENARDLAWSPDVGASFLVDLLTLREYGEVEFARDVLRYFAFVPRIDSLFYAPKVAFSSAYFGSVDEPDRLRDDLRRFNNDLPRGKRLYEKLKDLLGTAGVLRALRAFLREDVALHHAAEDAAGQPLDDFFSQWLGPYPFVHYELIAVESRREGEEFVHHARVRKHGDVVEPVVLWARDESGRDWSLRWDGKGRSHDFAFRSPHPLDVVHLDPKERLIERWPGRHDDLRLDNRRPARWKFLFHSFSALLDVVQLQPAFALDFTLRRVYDLDQSFGLTFFRSQITDWGTSVGYGRNFGSQIDQNRRAGIATAGLSASRLNEDFAVLSGMEPRPGTRLGLSLGVGYDDRLWFIDARRGLGAGLGAGTQVTLLDDGARLWTYSVGAAVTKLWQITPTHVLAALLSSGAVMGDIELASQLVRVGGPGGLIGYEADELLGRGRAVGTIEYRHTFVRGLDWNVLHIARGRGFGGALFFDAATLASRDDLGRGWFESDNTFFHAGYSLRAHFDYLGVSQALLRADVGVPLNRPDSEVSRAPVGFVISFGPSF